MNDEMNDESIRTSNLRSSGSPIMAFKS